MKRHADASPKTRSLFKVYQNLNRTVHRSKRELVNFKKRLHLAEKSLSHNFMKHFATLKPPCARFLLSQIRESRKGKKGRRFTVDDKVFALALWKRSGRAYNFLSESFVLPAKTTLNRFLQNVKISPGINDQVFQNLENVAKKMKAVDKHCILMFDEMSLSAHLHYNEHLDVIEGFHNLGDGNTRPDFADKALVFMIRGLARRYKQPVGFTFPSTCIKTAELSALITEVVKKLTSSGFKVMATVCDQAPSNVAAINRLVANTAKEDLRCVGEHRGEYFKVADSEEVIPLFDPPHLLKGVRNALLKSDLECTLDGEALTASWKHVQELYAKDTDTNRAVPFLTDRHVRPESVQKMKVKYCTQVFSQRVSSIMQILARASK